MQLLLAAMSLHLTSPVPLFILNESYETLDVLICARVEVEAVGEKTLMAQICPHAIVADPFQARD